MARTSALALAADLAGKLAQLALVLVAARVLPLAEFARVASYLAAVGLLAAALDSGAQTVLTRDGAATPERMRALFGALAQARVPLAAAALGAAALLGARSALVATLAIALAAASATTLTGVCRSAQRMRPELLSKLALGVSQLLALVLALVLGPTAETLLWLLAAAYMVALLPLAGPARALLAAAPPAGRERSTAALARALPFGLMAVATLAFYRSGTLALAAWSTTAQTAAFAVAANVGFGLLALSNAITTALLPRLAATSSAGERAAIVRRALAWALGLTFAAAAACALAGPILLPALLGEEFAAASLPLALLGGAACVIACNGVLGTVLVASGRTGRLAVQVAVSLAVNLAVLAVAVPVLGATGAALATLACEAVALALLVPAAVVALPELRASTVPRPVAAGAAG